MSHFLAALDCGLMGVPRPSIPLHCTAQGMVAGRGGVAAKCSCKQYATNFNQTCSPKVATTFKPGSRESSQGKAPPACHAPHCHPLATLTNFCIKTLAQSFFLLLLRALHGCSCNNFSTTNFLFVWLCCNYTQIGRGRKRERKGERESERGQQMEFSIFISLPAVFIAASMLHMKSFWHFHSL